MSVIIALDASSTNVGYCIAEDDDYILSGVYSPKGNADERVKGIVLWIEDKAARYEPHVLVLEEPAANNAHANARTDRLLSRVVGAIEAVAILQSIAVDRVYPSQVRATGCHKKNLIFAASLAGKREIGPDEADAIGVWLAFLSKVQRKPTSRRKQ